MNRFSCFGKAAAFLILATLTISAASAAADGLPLVPNDPGWPAEAVAMNQIQAPAAWAAMPCTVTVADIGSGVNPVADLGQALLPGYNSVNGSSDASDIDGHNTVVASVIAAPLNNGIGLGGVCGQGHVVPVKVYDAPNHFYNTALASGIGWAVSQGIKVINLSLYQSHDSADPVVYGAIERAEAAGVTVVVIAGNGTDNDLNGSSSPQADPLSCGNPDPLVIKVAGVNADNQLDPWSNYGVCADIAAPIQVAGYTLGGDVQYFKGTSFAAPQVAATVAYLQSYAQSIGRSLSPAEVRAALFGGCTSVPALNVSSHCVLNVMGALQAIRQLYPPRVKLTVRATGLGSVVVTDGLRSVSCHRICTPPAYPTGSGLELVAMPAKGWRFRSWNGGCGGSRTVCRITIRQNTTVSAMFVKTSKKK
jgi:thermitase